MHTNLSQVITMSTFLALTICALILATTNIAHARPLKHSHVPLFVFGDSMFDAGNNNFINTTFDFRANFLPYGQDFAFAYPTGRCSNGLIIPDFIGSYAKLPLMQPYLKPGKDEQFMYGANFASAGGGALVEIFQGFVIGLRKQLGYYKIVGKQLRQKVGEAKAKKMLSSGVHLISIGSNDYISFIIANSNRSQPNYSQQQYVGMVNGNITDVIREIYKEGGRKFGFLGLETLGCLPVMKARNNGSCINEANALAQLHNSALVQVLKKLECELKGFKYSFFDFYTSVGDRMQNPSKYGFKEGMAACCGTGLYRGINSCGGKRSVTKQYELCENASEYLFFDASHPTEVANKQYADMMWEGGPQVTGPYNLKALFQQ